VSHLLAISIGPVQEFIAAARRTRDLWFGSYLLSEVSRAVAIEVENQGGTLIFPASTHAENVANVIVAELPAGDPRELAARAKQSAQECWLAFADQARREAARVIQPDIWDDQAGDVIEFYAAWLARSTDYRADRARVMRLLDGRKNGRDFTQAEFDDTGFPKSSLDGQRPTVLKRRKPDESPETYRKDWPRKLRLSEGEQLDILGVAKRLGKQRGEAYPTYSSVARVAAETWLQGVRKRSEFEALKAACQKLTAKGLNTVREDHYQYFPYEGTVIYRNRHPDLIEELGLHEHDLDEVAGVLEDLGGEPNPYLAVLVADGDRMGAAISKRGSVQEHQAFSQALAGFAHGARAIVNGHDGVLVYAGGDDVLAFVPLGRCLACARSLHDKFVEQLRAYDSLTLSIGMAIGHFMENLEDLLQYGRAAEKRAKHPDRDGLAIHVHKRGGTPIKMRAHWRDSPDGRITRYAELMRAEVISGKLPYDLRNLARLYEGWPRDDALARAIRQDVIRVIRDKQPRSARHGLPEIEAELKQRVTDARSLHQFAEELLIARQVEVAP
jgi:CRISPR-associated protein Cmr2